MQGSSCLNFYGFKAWIPIVGRHNVDSQLVILKTTFFKWNHFKHWRTGCFKKSFHLKFIQHKKHIISRKKSFYKAGHKSVSIVKKVEIPGGCHQWRRRRTRDPEDPGGRQPGWSSIRCLVWCNFKSLPRKKLPYLFIHKKAWSPKRNAFGQNCQKYSLCAHRKLSLSAFMILYNTYYKEYSYDFP